MSDKGWKSKGAKVPRRSPRKQGKTCGRPFNAPRTKTVKQKTVAEVQECEVQVIEKASDHEARQAGAKDELKDILNRNGRRSYGSLEKAINNWCCKNTIMYYLKSFEDYITYSQNVRPLLSEGNRLKQVAFSTHVRNRWGLGPNKKNTVDHEVSLTQSFPFLYP